MKKPFPYRLAAIDIDGTLLGPVSHLGAENIAAVAKLKKHGTRVVLASGRCHNNIIGFHKELNLEGPIISSQGAQVKIVESGRIIREHHMPAGLAAEVVAEGSRLGMTLVYYRSEGIYICGRNSNTDLYHSRGLDDLIIHGPLETLAGDTPLKIIWMGSPEQIIAISPEIELRYRGWAETVVTFPEYLEFLALGVSKAVALEAVASYYGIDRSEIMAFGDGNNDISMLQWAGLGVAMSESTQGARDAADMVAPVGESGSSLARAVDEIFGNFDAPDLKTLAVNQAVSLR